MAVTPTTAGPYIYTHPYIQIGDATTGVSVECSATHVALTVDQDENVVETFCGVFTSYKAEKWVLTITGAINYGTTGIWNLLRPLCGTTVPFVVRPSQAGAVSVSNPEAQGTGYLKAFPFIDADPGGATEADIVMGVQGVPVFDTTP